MLRTRFTESFGVRHPIASAGMAFVATTPLTNAVCAAGGFGVLGSAGMPPDVLRGAIRDIRQAGHTAFGVNIIPRFATAEHVAVCTAEKVPVVVFYWDDPAPDWLSDLKSANVRVAYQVGSVAEAKTKAASADLLIVQGSEAGGHNRAEAALFSIVPAVVDALGGKLPILAAGGVADGRGLAAVLALGADGVSIGTRFLATPEAFAHDEYKKRIVVAAIGDTARHNIFGPDFADATVRGLRNAIVREWEKRDEPAPYKANPPDTQPIIGQAVVYGRAMPMPRFLGLPPTREFSGDFDQMSLLAGESVGLTNDIRPAGDLVAEIARAAEAIVNQRLARMTAP
jgi:NAD(P)H-dependent flavin oxidoreductase YrpB (nitropropane dioxygenase family)